MDILDIEIAYSLEECEESEWTMDLQEVSHIVRGCNRPDVNVSRRGKSVN